MTGARLRVTSVRLADADDLAPIAGIEDAGDARFRGLVDMSGLGAAPTGAARVAAGGTLLVVGQPAVGFAHVVDRAGGGAELAQICVHPEAGRQGIGEMLLRAALGIALDAGYADLHLDTVADVPFNAAWYAAHGFRGSGVRAGEEPARVDMVRALADSPTPIPAVSVIPVRDGPGGIEAFVQHRVATMDFAPGVLVFPGGRVDGRDREAGARLALAGGLLGEQVSGWAETAYDMVGRDPAEAARTLVATALREVAEETGARLDPARLLPWDDWVTPIGVPKRFDVRFYLYPVDGPEAAAFSHMTGEAHHSEWLPLADVVCRTETAEIALLPPTRTLVDELSALGTVASAADLRPPVTMVRHDIAARRPRHRQGAATTVGG